MSPSGEGNGARLLSAVGLCARARRLLIGAAPVVAALRQRGRSPALAVLEASDVSGNTHSRLSSACARRGVPLLRLPAGADELARAIGKTRPVVAVGVTDAHLLSLIRSCLP